MWSLVRKVKLWWNYRIRGGKPPWLQGIGAGTEPTIEEIFTHIHAKNVWHDRDSASGSGSNLTQTEVVRARLPGLIQELQVATMLDIPCGDYHWLSRAKLELRRYIGADIVQGLVDANQARYAVEQPGRSVSFVRLDLLISELPCVDLVLCRDCLVHFSDDDVWQALRQIKRSGSTYFLTTTFSSRTNDKKIETGDWRPLNLEAAPFRFPPPMVSIVEECTEEQGKYADKTLALWRIADLP